MEDSFALLEEKVQKAADLVKRLRKENKTLAEESAKVKAAMQDAEKKLLALQKEHAQLAQQSGSAGKLEQEVEEMKRERTEVRNRIAKLVELLETLD